jgi:hypothetical protein
MRFHANGIVLQNETNMKITSKATELILGRSVFLSNESTAPYIDENKCYEDKLY